MSFSALVVVGDPGAKIVGFGTGKAKEVPAAIKKGIEAAKKNLRRVNVLETTIQHVVLGQVRQRTCSPEASSSRYGRDCWRVLFAPSFKRLVSRTY